MDRIWYLGEWWEKEYSTAECNVYRSADGKKRLYEYWDGKKEVKPYPAREGGSNMMISEDEAIKQLEMLGFNRGEAKRFLVAPDTEKRAIIKAVQERAGVEIPPFYYKSFWPMSPEEGPPLPRKLGIRWPWK